MNEVLAFRGVVTFYNPVQVDFRQDHMPAGRRCQRRVPYHEGILGPLRPRADAVVLGAADADTPDHPLRRRQYP